MQNPSSFVYEGAQPYIFVSYSHRDSHTVMPLIRGMQRQGIRVWYDEEIEHGSLWQETIAQRLMDCGCMLVFISAASVNSAHCRNEISFGVDQHKPMLVVYLEDCGLTPGLQLALGPVQAMRRGAFSNDSLLLEALCAEPMFSPCTDRDTADLEHALQGADRTIEAIGTVLDRLSQVPMALNHERLQQFSEAYRIMEKAAAECGALLTYRLHEPYLFHGAISLCGSELIFKDSSELSRAIAFASNVEIYPKVDGTVQMNLAFNDLACPISD